MDDALALFFKDTPITGNAMTGDAMTGDAFSTDAEARASAEAFVHELATRISAHLGHGLLGVYMLGSLAHGGFSRRYSDLDIGVFTMDGLSDDDLAAIRALGHPISEAWTKKLSIFWTDRTCTAGRFPPLDRLDFLDHAVRVVEHTPIAPARPSLADVRAYLAGRPIENWAAAVAGLIGQPALEAAHHKPAVRAFLYPARFAYSWQTGLMASNDDAVAFLHDGHAAGLDLALVDLALDCRRRAADPDALFARRSELRHQLAACRALAASSP